MDLRSEKPYALLKNGLVHAYPSLHKNIQTDVVVCGAGITGALVAWHLVKKGIPTVVVDRRHVGMGSTAASTALLQYEIDTPLYKLIKLVGEKNAVLSYLLCRQAIYDLQEICLKLPKEVSFVERPSFQFASYKLDVRNLQKEYELRKKIGINLQWMTAADVKATFGFTKPAGILSADGATVDAYRLAHSLLLDGFKWDLRVFDNTRVTQVAHYDDHVILHTDWGFTIKAKKLVVACGYESQDHLPKKVERLRSTYSIISEPLPNSYLWYKEAMIWETSDPYLYLRTTPENRILVGGKDDNFVNPSRRDAAIHRKTILLENAFQKLFPHIPFRTDFAWAGTFSGTRDGLPYIGTIPERANTWFAMGYGGNGITFGVIAAQIISDALAGKNNKQAAIFSFDR